MSSDCIKVLLVEDHPADARLVHELLIESAHPVALQTVKTLRACLAKLGESQFDVVILDLSLPDSQGLSTCTAVQRASADCPIVVVSGLDERSVAVEAVKHGAQDYLVKDQLEPELLIRSLTYAVERARLQQTVRLSEEQFRQLAENIRDVFWIYDVDTNEMIYLSPAHESVWGRPQSRAPVTLDRFFADVLRDDRRRVVKAFRERATTGEYREEYRIVRPDGQMRWIWDRGVPLTNADGCVYRVVGVAEDVTPRKELESQVLEAATREQQRISQDLHDSVGQQLTGVSYMALSLARKLADTSETESAVARAISEASQDALGEVRHAIRGLAPVELDSHGLMSALEHLANTTHERFDIGCRFTYDHSVLIDDNNVATHLFRIAQEATNNAVKHAASDNIVLHLDETPDRLELSIQDDGTGFEPHVRCSGLGLNTMRYRARAIGATLDIHSSPAAGVKVVCTLEKFTDPRRHERFGAHATVADHDR